MDLPLPPPTTTPLPRDELISRIGAALADNNTQGISAEDVRSRLYEIVASMALVGEAEADAEPFSRANRDTGKALWWDASGQQVYRHRSPKDPTQDLRDFLDARHGVGGWGFRTAAHNGTDCSPALEDAITYVKSNFGRGKSVRIPGGNAYRFAAAINPTLLSGVMIEGDMNLSTSLYYDSDSGTFLTWTGENSYSGGGIKDCAIILEADHPLSTAGSLKFVASAVAAPSGCIVERVRIAVSGASFWGFHPIFDGTLRLSPQGIRIPLVRDLQCFSSRGEGVKILGVEGFTLENIGTYTGSGNGNDITISGAGAAGSSQESDDVDARGVWCNGTLRLSNAQKVFYCGKAAAVVLDNTITNSLIVGALGVISGTADSSCTVINTSDVGAARCVPDIFTSNGTWNKRYGVKHVFVRVIGSGGSGGGGARVASGAAASGGGGGGGACRNEAWFDPADLGLTETVTVGAPPSGGLGATSNGAVGGDGAQGNQSLFGTKLASFRGGLGAGGQLAGNSGGGGGAGLLGSGSNATGATAGGAGSSTGSQAGGSGAGGTANTNGGGGAGGGLNAGAGTAGGSAYDKGGGGGGAGGGIAATPVSLAGGSGGLSLSASTAPTGAVGANGTGGASPAAKLGQGGAGGPSNAAGAGWNGGNGGSYGGGGGGGGVGVGGNGGAGGAGGPGVVIAISFF